MPILTEQAQAVVDAHFAAEEHGDLAAIMSTVDDDIAFEFHPMGKQLLGKAEVEVFYDFFVRSFRPRLKAFYVRDQWASESMIAVDQILWVAEDGGTLRMHSALGIIGMNERFVCSERVYLSAELLSLMAGPSLTLLKPMAFKEPPIRRIGSDFSRADDEASEPSSA